MLKKRIVFTLLFENGSFVLSRNFRLQKVGDLTWLERNYNFSSVSFHIDELVLIDVTRVKKDEELFCNALSSISKGCFAPITAGGGVRSVASAKALLRAGADKIVVNTSLFENQPLISELAAEFGQQCIVGSVDVRRKQEGYEIVTQNGQNVLNHEFRDALSCYCSSNVGELYINSIDQDGTGQGYDLEILKHLPVDWSLPVIMAGGVGNAHHLSEGLSHPQIDAVATANLFNFMGDGLKKARQTLTNNNFDLAVWPDINEANIKN